jgi:hypothetical protein
VAENRSAHDQQIARPADTLKSEICVPQSISTESMRVGRWSAICALRQASRQPGKVQYSWQFGSRREIPDFIQERRSWVMCDAC